MAVSSFDCKYGPSTIKISITDEGLRIKQPMLAELIITNDNLIQIDFETLSNPLPMIGWCFNLIIVYKVNQIQKKKKIVLQYEQAVNIDCMEFLSKAFPEKSLLKPNNVSKNYFQNATFADTYRIHAIFPIAMLLTAFLVFSIMGILFLVMPNSDKMSSQAGMTFAGVILSMLSLFILFISIKIIAKSFYIVTTSQTGIKIKKLLKKIALNWQDIKIGIPDFRVQQLYGEYCVNSDAFFVIPFESNRGNKFFVKMTSNQAGKFFRELYYRELVDFETARKAGAFF